MVEPSERPQWRSGVSGRSWPNSDCRQITAQRSAVAVAPHNAGSIREIGNPNFQELTFIQGMLFFIAGYTFANLLDYFPATSSLPPGITTPT